VSKSKTEFAFFLGCTIPASQIFVEKSTGLVAKKLGIKLVDFRGATCCPEPEMIRLVGHDAWLRIAARNLSIAETMGCDVCVVCPGCYDTFAKANDEFRHDSKLLDDVNQSLLTIGKHYSGKINIRHIIDLIYSDVGLARLKKLLVKRFNGLRVAAQYGCRLQRETEMEYLKKFDEILLTIGVEIVRYNSERLCCGVPTTHGNPEFALEQRAKVKLEEIKKAGADAIVLVCPACYDMLEKAEFAFFDPENFVPVINLVELIALGLGFSPEEIGMDIHRIPIERVLEKLEAV
jgi:heterodisulfide reductase subunit B